MIVKNEEAVLERCLSSVRDAVDEIVIVDTGSADRTLEIAAEWTDRIYPFEWIDDFSAARNASFAYATQSYILWLDADDVLLEQDRKELMRLKETLDPSIDAVSMLYHCNFDEAGNVTMTVRRMRLVKRTKHYCWEGAVHEDLQVQGVCMDTDIAITHKKRTEGADPMRNLNLYARLLARGEKLSARDKLHYAMELHKVRRYEQALEMYGQFMELRSTKEEEKIYVSTRLADCHYQLGDRERELAVTFQTFRFDIPRPEQCCRIGYSFLEKGRYEQAIYWYKQALEVPLPANRWAIHGQVARTWLPHMHLGTCYAQLNDYESACRHYRIACQYNPEDAFLKEQVERTSRLLHSAESRQ